MAKLKALYILHAAAYDDVYAAVHEDISALVNVYAPPQTRESVLQNPALLADAEIIFAGWGTLVFDADTLRHLPKLKAVFYGAGSIKYLLSPAFWAQGVRICSANPVLALPVAEFALAQILLSLEGMWQYSRAMHALKRKPDARAFPGTYGSTVGLISLGVVARHLLALLWPFDLKVIAYDPFAEVSQFPGLEFCGLDEVFQRADVVSLHTPWLPETEGMITGAHFRAMKPNSSFINTARGAIVREDEMIAALQDRPDITALLDVTYPEPPAPESPLYTLPNVVLTPHIAGPTGRECRRMGELMLAELRSYLADGTLKHEVRQSDLATIA